MKGGTNLNKLLKSIVILCTILFLLSPISFATDVNFKDQIKKEDVSLFEKIIAECIGGIAQLLVSGTLTSLRNCL